MRNYFEVRKHMHSQHNLHEGVHERGQTFRMYICFLAKEKWENNMFEPGLAGTYKGARGWGRGASVSRESAMEGPQVDLRECLETAIKAARGAGHTILEGFSTTKDVSTKLGPWDLVTEYDKRTENIIISVIRNEFPTHLFIGEESQEEAVTLTDSPTWIIDPIDGTSNFVHGFYESCASIALSVDKELVVGVVYNPMLNMMYTACKGKGAFLNNDRIHVSNCKEIANSLMAVEVSFAHIPQIRTTVLKRLEGLAAHAQGIRSLGSAALALGHLAKGSLDGYHIDGLQCWDVAAGVVIIREAGGTVVDTSGGPFDMMSQRIVAAATPSLAQEMVKVIKMADEKLKEN